MSAPMHVVTELGVHFHDELFALMRRHVSIMHAADLSVPQVAAIAMAAAESMTNKAVGMSLFAVAPERRNSVMAETIACLVSNLQRHGPELLSSIGDAERKAAR